MKLFYVIAASALRLGDCLPQLDTAGKSFYLQLDAPGQSYHGAYLNIPTEGGTHVQGASVLPGSELLLLNLGNSNTQFNIPSSPSLRRFLIDGRGTLSYSFYDTTTNKVVPLSLAFSYPQAGDYQIPILANSITHPPVPKVLAYPKVELSGSKLTITGGTGTKPGRGTDSGEWVVCGGTSPYWAHVLSTSDHLGRPVDFRTIYWGPPGVWSNPSWGSAPCASVSLTAVYTP